MSVPIFENMFRGNGLILRRYTILDEADEMLDASWEETMKPMLAGGGRLSPSVSLSRC